MKIIAQIFNWIAYTLIFVSITLIALVSSRKIGCFAFPNLYHNLNSILGYISALMATANASLLFSTLTYQRESFKLERFESVLFGLLDNHKKLVGRIQFTAWQMNDDGNTIEIPVTEKNLFDFAMIEVERLKTYLSQKDYPILDKDYQGTIEAIESGILTYSMEKYLNECQQGFISEYYSVSPNQWDKYKSEGDVLSCAYKIFLCKWNYYYCSYFRSIILLFSHIDNNLSDKREKEKYKKYVTAQMQKAEREFLKLYYSYNAEFSALINNIWRQRIQLKLRKESGQ